MPEVITNNLELWTSALLTKSTAGRGSNGKLEAYGIKKLRELILELAVHGKLVPQESNDEPASVLLSKIFQANDLLQQKTKKRHKEILEISVDEIDFELPHGWVYVRNGSIFSLRKGKKPKNVSVEQIGSPYLDLEALDRGNILKFTDDDTCPRATIEDILVVCDGSRSGLVLEGKNGVIGSTLAVIDTPDIIKPFIKLLFVESYERLNSTMKGAAIPHLDTNRLIQEIVGLPPLAEQHRIVSKVDELMALCDQLEQQQTDAIADHQTLVETLLGTLTNVESQQEQAEAWTRVANHFDTLFTTEQSIDQLKQTILQLAVMGKLVPQDPNDEPASVLLEKIAKEKERQINEGKIKKQKELPEIREDQKLFEIPAGWGFSYLQDLCELITDGTHQTPTYTDEGRPFISAQCVKPFKFLPENCRFVSEEHYQDYIKNRKPEYRDILLSRVGAGIGEAALIDNDLEFAIYVSTGLLKPFKDLMLSEYLVLWLNSPVGRHHSEKYTYGKGVSQGNLNLSLVRSFLVSVPPLKEQHLIVAKVDELMTLCDALKARLADAQTTQIHLADAIVEQAVA